MTPFAGNNQVTSPFGWRTSPITGGTEHHNGEDIITRGDWVVREVSGGRVSEASYGYNGGRGNLVRVQVGEAVETYQHLESIAVQPGQAVAQGDKIGVAGSSGDSTGRHLHFEVTVGGRAVVPAEWSGVPNLTGDHAGNDTVDRAAEPPAPVQPREPKKSVETKKSAKKKNTPSASKTGKTPQAAAPQAENLYATGRRITDLKGAPLYATAYDDTVANYLPDAGIGVVNPFYIHDGEEVNGRYRITNSAARVGSGQVTGWLDRADIH